MSDLLLEPTSTAQWRQLVTDAQSSAQQRLDEELESYLVFLLLRFTHAPQVVQSIVALDYLESQLAHGKVRHERLREVGDRCLLFSGFISAVGASSACERGLLREYWAGRLCRIVGHAESWRGLHVSTFGAGFCVADGCAAKHAAAGFAATAA
jgi:hypothetical protein